MTAPEQEHNDAQQQPDGVTGDNHPSNPFMIHPGLGVKHWGTIACAGAGLVSFLFVAQAACLVSSEPDLAESFGQLDPDVYKWPMCAFITALIMNLLTLLFERETTKFQLALLACYINILAALNDYLSWKGVTPIIRDPWGHGVQILRPVMWLWTTPAMVYLLGLTSDFSHFRIMRAVVADIVMLGIQILATVQPSRPLAVVMTCCSMLCFAFLMPELYHMFEGALTEAGTASGRQSLLALRNLTVGLWFLFPLVYLAAHANMLTLAQEEWLWTVSDFLGKVIFSTSLLQGNFLTMQQRRLIAMRVVEESNRLQVIQQLTNLVEQKERFMSGMSHELRTPLNGIIGLSDALIIGGCGPVNEQVLKTITTIKTSGSRLLNLINDILDAASMRTGKLVIKHEKVNLTRLVDDVLELCQPLARRGVKLANNIPSSLPTIRGDNGRIIQILHNLVGNSCKFTHSGSICVSAVHKGDEVEVSVSDSGIGIPDDKFESIFQAFEQVDMSTTRKYGGTGLGLNLVKQLVEAHDGRISVRSKLGAGTTFFFTLKAWDPARDTDVNDFPGGALHGAHSPPASTPGSPPLEQSPGHSHSKHAEAGKGAAASVLATEAAAQALTRMGSLGAGSAAHGDRLRKRLTRGPSYASLNSLLNKMQPQATPSGGHATAAAIGPANQDRSSEGGSAADTAGSQQSAPAQGLAGGSAVMTGMPATGHSGPGDEANTNSGLVRVGSVGELAAAARVKAQPSSSRLALHSVSGVPGQKVPGLERMHRASSLGQGLASALTPALGKGSPAPLAEPVSSSAAAPLQAVPAKSPAAAVAGDTKRSPGSPQARGQKAANSKVLVLSVDDDPVNQMVIQNLLTPEGYEVQQAMDGQEALEVIADMQPRMPDLILLDVMMPGMSGYEVCRKLRELYPLSCIPIIMVSAKSKEEHIVEGLAAGSNDYVIKPFGRQEILARISAHLKFKEEVFAAGEASVEGQLLLGRGRNSNNNSDDFTALMQAKSKQFSLPMPLKRLVENSAGTPAHIQMFDNLTMCVIGITNLEELIGSLLPEDLLGAVTSLLVFLDDLLARHNCHMVDCLEQRMVVVAGLSGEPTHEQVTNMLALVTSLYSVAANLTASNGPRLQLSSGIHTTAAQGVLVGVNHPVCSFIGALPDKATQLQATCPPECIQVSQRVYDCVGSTSDFVPGITLFQGGSEMTYLHASGPYKEHQPRMQSIWEKYLSTHPFGPINSTALRLRPMQQALISLIQCDPSFLSELFREVCRVSYSGFHALDPGREGGSSAKLRRLSTRLSGIPDLPGLVAAGASSSGRLRSVRSSAGLAASAAAALTNVAGSGTALNNRQSVGGEVNVGASSQAAEIQRTLSKVTHEKALLQRQLDEVSEEAARLQDQVDELEKELKAARAQGQAGPTSGSPPSSSSEEVANLRRTAATLQEDLARAKADAQHLESVVASLEEEVLKLPPLQAALAAAQADNARLQSLVATLQEHQACLVSQMSASCAPAAGGVAPTRALVQKLPGSSPIMRAGGRARSVVSVPPGLPGHYTDSLRPPDSSHPLTPSVHGFPMGPPSGAASSARLAGPNLVTSPTSGIAPAPPAAGQSGSSTATHPADHKPSTDARVVPGSEGGSTAHPAPLRQSSHLSTLSSLPPGPSAAPGQYQWVNPMYSMGSGSVNATPTAAGAEAASATAAYFRNKTPSSPFDGTAAHSVGNGTAHVVLPSAFHSSSVTPLHSAHNTSPQAVFRGMGSAGPSTSLSRPDTPAPAPNHPLHTQASPLNSDPEGLAAARMGGSEWGGSTHRAGSTTQGHGPALSSDMDMDQVLHALGLDHLAKRFEQEQVTPSLLPFLEEGSLEALGVTSVGAKLKLKAAAALWS